MELDVRRIHLGRRCERLARIGKAFWSVITKAEKGHCLHMVRMGAGSIMERSDGRLEMSLLELSQAQIQLHAFQLRIEGQRLLIRCCRFRIFLLFREIDSKTGES